MASQTASIVVTDLVASTEHRVRLGEERAEELRRAHDRELVEIIADAGGTVVKGLGDGVLASFDSAAEALSAAVAAQRRIGPALTPLAGEPVEVRVGVSAGDVTVEGGDCFGTPVVEASRLCAGAQPGEVLVADVVVTLARGRGGHTFEAVGPLALKGLPDAVIAHRVVVDHAATGPQRPPDGLRYQVLGGLAVLGADGPLDLGGPKQRAVLAALLLEPGQSVPADRLADMVWGDQPPASADGSLQAYVANLRRALEPGRRPREAPRILLTVPAGYVMAVERDDLDLTRFEGLAATGHRLLAEGDAGAARQVLDAALSAWTGPLLPELADSDWVVRSAERLSQLRAQVLEDRADAGLALGETGELVAHLRSAIELEPYRERLHAQLALALYRAGRQREALLALQEVRRVLVDEVGIEPGPALRQLESDILAQVPALDAGRPVATAIRAPERPAPVIAPPTERAADTAPGRDASLVGRDTELAVLLDAYTHVAAGEGRPVVVSGEPGIGKTRLVEELTARVPDAVVAWGRCPESAVQSAYWPCIQIGRQLEGAEALDPAVVSTLLPVEDVQLGEPAVEQLPLQLAVAKMLTSTTRPLVLVVDDLQWADVSSLRMIEFVAAEVRRAPVLLVVTTRPVGPDAPAALVDCLGELARQPGAVRIELGGLSRSEVQRWIDRRVEGRAIPEVTSLVLERTGGNPFFVGEVIELLAGEGRLTDADAVARGTPVPAAVQDVVRRRVNRLPPATQQVLAAASVVGRWFDADIVGAMTGLEPLDVLDALEPATDAGLAIDGDRPGRFQFAHVLVADTMIAELSAARRARLHAATAEAIVRLRAGDIDAHVAEVAHHAMEGALAGTAEHAYEWSVRAARQASARLAHDDAAGHWQRAVQALELARPGDRQARVEALTEQGIAHLRVDDVAAGYTALVAAIDLAIELDDPVLIARAAAAMNVDTIWMAGEVGATAVDAVRALERALDALPDGPVAERLLARGALADNAYWQWPTQRLDDFLAETLSEARAHGDPAIVARTLQKRVQALWRARTEAEREAAADELLELSQTTELPPPLHAVALFQAGATAWERGDVTGAERFVQAAAPVAQRTGSPALITQLGFFRTSIHCWYGRFDAAEESLQESYELYRRTRRWAAESIRAGSRLVILAERDQLDLVLDEDLPHLLAEPYGRWFREGVALALTEAGRLDDADALLQGTPPPLDDCWLYVGVLCAAAHSRCALGDVATARMIRDHLRPLGPRLGTVGTGAGFGDLDFALARIEQLLGDTDAARRHIERSVDFLRRTGEGPWVARSLLFHAELTGDQATWAEAAEMVERLDLRLLRRRIHPST